MGVTGVPTTTMMIYDERQCDKSFSILWDISIDILSVIIFSLLQTRYFFIGDDNQGEYR